MKKRIRFVGLLAGITVIGIVIFQVYWVYNSYRTEERNFYKSVTISLQNSITAYMEKEVKIPVSFVVKSSTVTAAESTDQRLILFPNTLLKDTLRQFRQRGSKPSLEPRADRSREKAIAAIISQNLNKPLKMALLDSILQDELRKNNLPVSFSLKLLKKQKELPENRVAAFRGNDVVIADIANVNQYLLPRILVPALVSLLLIFLSAASIYYMGIIIRRQMKLDSMKSDFFGNIAHELRTPISILKSTHEALYNFGSSSDPEITSRYLQINIGILDKMDSNVDRILDISRYEQGFKPVNMERVDLAMLVKEAIAQFQLNNQTSIQYELPAKLFVNTDRYIILTVLTNLVDNAVKYASQSADIQIMVRPGEHHWELEVKDNGQGISEQYLPYIFDKFYRVPSGDIHDVKGYGLGLSYVKELVSALNGTISVKSKLGMGTTFIVKFPVYGGD